MPRLAGVRHECGSGLLYGVTDREIKGERKKEGWRERRKMARRKGESTGPKNYLKKGNILQL